MYEKMPRAYTSRAVAHLRPGRQVSFYASARGTKSCRSRPPCSCSRGRTGSSPTTAKGADGRARNAARPDLPGMLFARRRTPTRSGGTCRSTSRPVSCGSSPPPPAPAPSSDRRRHGQGGQAGWADECLRLRRRGLDLRRGVFESAEQGAARPPAGAVRHPEQRLRHQRPPGAADHSKLSRWRGLRHEVGAPSTAPAYQMHNTDPAIPTSARAARCSSRRWGGSRPHRPSDDQTSTATRRRWRGAPQGPPQPPDCGSAEMAS